MLISVVATEILKHCHFTITFVEFKEVNFFLFRLFILCGFLYVCVCSGPVGMKDILFLDNQIYW